MVKDLLSVEVGGYSLKGNKAVNGDAFAVNHPSNHNVLRTKGVTACIADGASHSDDQQLSSHTAVTHFIEDYYSTPGSWSVKKSSAKVLNALNSWLYQHSVGSESVHQQHSHNKLLTTFSAIVFKSTTAHMLHAGDSRIYQLRGRSLEQLTRDHHYHTGGKAILSRGLGVDSRLDVDYLSEELKVGDVYLLSTDGLHQYLSKQEMIENLSDSDENLEILAINCVEQALENGSDDNVSCLLLRIKSLPDSNQAETSIKSQQLHLPPVMSVGNTIDGFTVKDIIYSGPRSHIYLVADSDGKPFALKAPSLNFSEDKGFIECFSREEWVGRRLNHPNILKIYPRPDNSQFNYHVSEYVNGISLRQWMYDNPEPSFDSVRQIVKNIVVALRVFQRNDIVHRDLKPENIMLDDQGNIKIIDFGAVQIDSLDETAASHDSLPLGTMDYSAPEYLTTGKGQHSADIFSLGVIVYEMLTGLLPYKSVQQKDASRGGEYRLSYHVRNDIPVWLDLALHKACQLNPHYRYQAMSEFMADISTPNKSMLNNYQESPLIERHPILVWKGISLILLVAVIYLLYSR